MSLFLKNKQSQRRYTGYYWNKTTIVILLLLSSCSSNKNPVKKNNDIFLSKYSKQIERAKQKHLKKAKDSGINYSEKTVDDLVDSSYYKARNSRKQMLDYVSSNELRVKDEDKNDPIYLEDDLSIYFRNRTLKDEYDDLGYELYDDGEKLRYLIENKNDYSEVKTDFNSIRPTKEKLYGELKLRNNDFYSSAGADVILKNYDYLYVMDTVKKELELKNKAAKDEDKTDSSRKTSNTKKVLDSLKSRFKELLGK